MEVMSDKRQRLSDTQVEALRRDYVRLCEALEPGDPVLEVDKYLAAKYSISTSSVATITSGESRKDAPGPITPRPTWRKKAQRKGFTAGIDVIIKDPAGRTVSTLRVPEGHTITTQPVTVPLEDNPIFEIQEV